MAETFLSQEEVDALFTGVVDESGDDNAGVLPCDLGMHEHIVRGRMPKLEVINQHFASLLRVNMSSFLRRSVAISLDELRRTKFNDFVTEFSGSTHFNLVRLNPLRGTALMVLDPDFVFLIVDNMFGGEGRFHSHVSTRDFTQTEQRILRRILDVIFTSYCKSWEPVFPIDIEYLRSEANPQLANIAMPNDWVIDTTLKIVLGTFSGEMRICLPYSMIAPIKDVLCNVCKERHTEDANDWAPVIVKHLEDAEVELVAHLGEAAVTLRDILSMKLGDVIPLTVRNVVAAEIDNVPVMDCSYGMLNGRYALRVERLMTRNGDQTI